MSCVTMSAARNLSACIIHSFILKLHGTSLPVQENGNALYLSLLLTIHQTCAALVSISYKYAHTRTYSRQFSHDTLFRISFLKTQGINFSSTWIFTCSHNCERCSLSFIFIKRFLAVNSATIPDDSEKKIVDDSLIVVS